MSDLQSDYKAFVAKLFNRTGDLSKDFTHAVLGIVTEIDELFHAKDATNALEERGDLKFFLVALQIVAEDYIAANPGQEVPAEETLLNFRKALEHIVQSELAYQPLHEINVGLMDEAKRWVGYGRQPKNIHLTMFKASLAVEVAGQLCDFQGTTWDDAMRANMAKLLVRYPGGEFDAYRAVERDLEAERAELEKH